MRSPSWIGYLLAAVMIVTAVYCVSRLAAARLRGRPTEPDVDIVHVLMGTAMAGMLVPRLSLLPDGAWEATFGAVLAWFGWQAIRAYRADGRAAHYLPHVLASGAMVYMFLAVTPARTGPALAAVAMDRQPAATIRFPVLALALALALFGYVMWITDRLPSVPAVSAMRLAQPAAVPARPGDRIAAGNEDGGRHRHRQAGDVRVRRGGVGWPGRCRVTRSAPRGAAVSAASRMLRDRDGPHDGLHADRAAVSTGSPLTS